MIKGIRLEGKKDATILVWTIKRPEPPKKVRIPLVFNADNYAIPCVEKDSRVKIGDTIGEPANAQSVSVHASVSGTVSAVSVFPHPVLGGVQSVEIETDKDDKSAPFIWGERKDWDKTSREELLQTFQNSGLVDFESGMKPIHIKAAARTKTIVLNACEPEPYQTSEHALMMSHPLEVLKGADILRWVMDAEEILIVTQDNKLEAAETLKSKIYFLKWKHAEVRVIPSEYPLGKEVMLRRVLGADYSAAELEIFHVASAFAVYEAVVFQKPLIERAVTIGGECLIEPKNAWVRLGTDLESAVKIGKGFLRQPGKLILGGPMTGLAQERLDVPILASTGALLGLPEELTQPAELNPCIRCGKCVESCPVDIHPAMISIAAENNQWEAAKYYGVNSCIECGNCSYVCPVKRPMVELIRQIASQGPAKRSRRRKLGL